MRRKVILRKEPECVDVLGIRWDADSDLLTVGGPMRLQAAAGLILRCAADSIDGGGNSWTEEVARERGLDHRFKAMVEFRGLDFEALLERLQAEAWGGWRVQRDVRSFRRLMG